MKEDQSNSRTRTIDRPGMVSAVFYIACIVLAVTMWELTQYINSFPYALAKADDPAALSKAQDAYAAVNNLLITLATGLLAGLGLYVTHRRRQSFARREFWPAALCGVFGCISLYWGYISSQNVQWAIENSIGTLDLRKLQWPRQLQCLTMLISVFFFAEVVKWDLTNAE